MIGTSILDIDCNNQLIFVSEKYNNRFAISTKNLVSLNSLSFDIKNSISSINYSESNINNIKMLVLSTKNIKYKYARNELKKLTEISFSPNKLFKINFKANNKNISSITFNSNLYMMNHELYSKITNKNNFDFKLSNVFNGNSIGLTKKGANLCFNLSNSSFNSLFSFSSSSLSSVFLSYKKPLKHGFGVSALIQKDLLNIRTEFPVKSATLASSVSIFNGSIASFSTGMKMKTNKTTTKVLLSNCNALIASVKYKFESSSHVLAGVKISDRGFNYCVFLSL